MATRPTLEKWGSKYADPTIRYDNKDLLEVWNLMLQAKNPSRDAYRQDLVMVASQCIANHALPVRAAMVAAYKKGDKAAFEKKAAEVCGLYLNPPANALVVCVDEKTGIQALGRKHPDKPERPGSRRKREFEYIRHGTASLFAAFLVHSGEVIADVKDRHTRVEFIEFMEELNRKCPKDKAIYVIVDNLAVHKTKEVRQWLTRHQRFEFVFTPTHASWLNQVEMWFSILTRRFLKDGIFDSKEELVERLMFYIKQYNTHAKPFRWTYASDPLCI